MWPLTPVTALYMLRDSLFVFGLLLVTCVEIGFTIGGNRCGPVREATARSFFVSEVHPPL